MKRLILAGFVLTSAFGAVQISTPPVKAEPNKCIGVLCIQCPEGTVLAPTNGNCCRCKPV